MGKPELGESAVQAFQENQTKRDADRQRRADEAREYYEFVHLAKEISVKGAALLVKTGLDHSSPVREMEHNSNKEVVKTELNTGNIVGIGSLDTVDVPLFGFAQVSVARSQKLGEWKKTVEQRRFRKDKETKIFVPREEEPVILGVNLNLFTSDEEDVTNNLVRIEYLAAGEGVYAQRLKYQRRDLSLHNFAKFFPWNDKAPSIADRFDRDVARVWDMPKLNDRLDVVIEALGVEVEPVVPVE